MIEYTLSKSTIVEIVQHQNGFAIEPIQKDDIKEILILCAKVFSSIGSPENIVRSVYNKTDWQISKKAVYNGKIVGCYLFNNQQIYEKFDLNDTNHVMEDLYPYTKKRGVQGVALAVLKEFRGADFGRQLRDIPLHMGYDYIWGGHDYRLQNREKWIKYGRRVVAEFDTSFYTLMDLK